MKNKTCGLIGRGMSQLYIPMRRGSVLATGMIPMMVGMQPPNAISPSMECPAMFLRALAGLP